MKCVLQALVALALVGSLENPMKKRWKLALLFALVVVLLCSWGGNSNQAPDQQLVGHLGHVCKIAERGIESPYRGVQKLFAYYGRHSPDMLKQFGDLLVTIERIKDDEAHDKRALVASRRLYKALASCERTYERFGLAIEADAKASQLFERGVTRFARTLEILFGGGAHGLAPSMPGLSMPGLRELLLTSD